MSEHIIDHTNFQYTKDHKCILHQKHNFIGVEQLELKNDMDGSCQAFDKMRNIYIRAGMGEMGIKRRWYEHVSASLRDSHINRSSKFYSCYLNLNCEKDNIPDADRTMGAFIQLEQLISIGLRKGNLEDIVNQFEWSDFELKGLSNLCGSGSVTSLIQKNLVIYVTYSKVPMHWQLNEKEIYLIIQDLNGN